MGRRHQGFSSGTYTTRLKRNSTACGGALLPQKPRGVDFYRASTRLSYTYGGVFSFFFAALAKPHDNLCPFLSREKSVIFTCTNCKPRASYFFHQRWQFRQLLLYRESTPSAFIHPRNDSLSSICATKIYTKPRPRAGEHLTPTPNHREANQLPALRRGANWGES